MDYAATTPVDDEALAAAMPYYKETFYNPSSAHALGQSAAAAVERARAQCAKAINAEPSEIYFTSGGTEAVNWAMSVARTSVKKRVAVSAIEHDAVLAFAKNLAESGYAVDYIKPDSEGVVTSEELKRL